MTGLEVTYLDTNKFSLEGNLTDIFLNRVHIKADCGQDGLKFGHVLSSSWSDGTTNVVLTTESDNLTANLVEVWYEASPHMEDGRPIVRSDTRPLDTETYFTGAGDDSTSIGGGTHLIWDFSNDDDLYTGIEVPSGFKSKQILMTFNCPVHLKDGSIYFFDAQFGSYINMDIIVPAGNYYPNPAGTIPAAALGLSDGKMYAYASSNTPYQRYVNRHHMYGDCPMGDELNAEGAAVNAVPVGWYVRGLIITPVSDSVSKGYGSLEMYRCHTMLLPGQTIENIH
jgi:hypothetical protein